MHSRFFFYLESLSFLPYSMFHSTAFRSPKRKPPPKSEQAAIFAKELCKLCRKRAGESKKKLERERKRERANWIFKCFRFLWDNHEAFKECCKRFAQNKTNIMRVNYPSKERDGETGESTLFGGVASGGPMGWQLLEMSENAFQRREKRA